MTLVFDLFPAEIEAEFPYENSPDDLAKDICVCERCNGSYWLDGLIEIRCTNGVSRAADWRTVYICEDCLPVFEDNYEMYKQPY
jgi:hypothetical protein